MYSKNVLLANLAIISIIILLTTNLSSASAAMKHITDPKQNYTISGDNVILHSIVGDIKIPIPDHIKAALRERNSKNKKRRISRQVPYNPNPNINYNFIYGFPDFFECNEQAQIALSAYSENHRYWEAFFKRNSINNTLAVS